VSDPSFEAFVAEWSTGLLRTAYLLTGDRGQARDLLQPALMTVDRHWDRFADHDTAAAFVRRELVMAHTGWRRRLRVGDLLAESPLLAGTSGLPGFARQAPDRGPQDELTTALAGLPPRVRAVLVLRHGDGLSAAATAELLGRPVDAVATDAARGLALLDTDGVQLSRHLTRRAQSVVAAPEEVRDAAREGSRAQRDHRLALAVLAVVLVAIVLLVVANL